MVTLNEDRTCYLSDAQRDVLLHLLTELTLARQFFLTGGTALAVFYLHHRCSNDLDFFTRQQVNLDDLDFWITRAWPGESTVIKKSPNFLSCLIRDTKLDLVIDQLSCDEPRPAFVFETGHSLTVDTIPSIVSNKFCACVSRREPTDYDDLYAIFNTFPDLTYEAVYALAKAKDAIFDDPPTAAFQLEEGVAFIKAQPDILPALRIEFDPQAFFAFYARLAMWLYNRLTL